jgi:outer membrane protein assembly factor BamB
VIGPAKLYPLQTVNVLAVSKMIIVLDKSNRKLWQSTLAFDVIGGLDALDAESATYGQGPCVERKGSLYVFDGGVLTAFDLANGNVRWRLPSVGIAGLFFDDHDMMYVNTTTASHEALQYSRQIDVSRKVVSVVLKIEPRSGKIVWTAQPGGLVNYVSGKFIFTVQEYMPEEEDEENPYTVETGFEKQPYLRIRRINPSNGHEMWEHFQQRAPLDVAFEKNTIRMVFKKEVQVLKFFSF